MRKRSRLRFGLLLYWGLSACLVHAQHAHTYRLDAGALVATGATPFWLRANQYGTVPLKANIARLNVGIWSDYAPADSVFHRRKLFDWGYGLNVVASAGPTVQQSVLPEAYLKGRIGPLEVAIGRRREVVGLADTLLSMGSYSVSGNALPIPKIYVGFPTFTPIPFTAGIFSVQGMMTHGWFGRRERLVQDSYLHQSQLYVRFGKPNWPFRLYGGLNHQAVWGGHSDVLSPLISNQGRLPSRLKYLPSVMLGTRNPFPNDPEVMNALHFDENRIGNHLGSLDIGADVQLGHWNVMAYRQFPYEDGSLFYRTNIADGLNGLRLRNHKTPTASSVFFLRQLTFEYLFTGSQGGDVFNLFDPLNRGRDDYFNNAQFIDGWTYRGRTIGTPMLTAFQEVTPALRLTQTGVVNNRVNAWHIGMSARLLSTIDLMGKLTYSRNAGRYDTPYLNKPGQLSGVVSAIVPVEWLGGTQLVGTMAADVGGLLPTSVGLYVGIRKTGWLGTPTAKTPAMPTIFSW